MGITDINKDCELCVYNYRCSVGMKTLCQENNYIIYTTKEDEEYCNMLCGNIEDY